MTEKVKTWVAENRRDLFTAAIIFLIGMASFGLGRLSVMLPDTEPIRLEDVASDPLAEAVYGLSGESAGQAPIRAVPVPPADAHGAFGTFVASKSGSVYYAAWCAGASRIREENKVWFQTKADAAAQGYRQARNCPGM